MAMAREGVNMYGKKLISGVIAGLVLLVGSVAFGTTGFALFSEKEANHLRHTDETWVVASQSQGASRGASQGPQIIFDQPSLADSGSGPVTLKSPANLAITFKAKNAPVDMKSLTVTAKKGFIKLPLTKRLTPYLDGNHLVANNLELPSGKFIIAFTIKDTDGGSTLLEVRFKVL